MNADSELDAPFRRQAGVALDHADLHFDYAGHRVDHAAEFDDRAVAGAFDDAPTMSSDCRIDQVAAEAAKTRKRPVLIDPGEPTVADDVGHQNRRELPDVTHRAPPAAGN